jgi:hypothetical protein
MLGGRLEKGKLAKNLPVTFSTQIPKKNNKVVEK